MHEEHAKVVRTGACMPRTACVCAPQGTLTRAPSARPFHVAPLHRPPFSRNAGQGHAPQVRRRPAWRTQRHSTPRSASSREAAAAAGANSSHAAAPRQPPTCPLVCTLKCPLSSTAHLTADALQYEPSPSLPSLPSPHAPLSSLLEKDAHTPSDAPLHPCRGAPSPLSFMPPSPARPMHSPHAAHAGDRPTVAPPLVFSESLM